MGLTSSGHFVRKPLHLVVVDSRRLIPLPGGLKMGAKLDGSSPRLGCEHGVNSFHTTATVVQVAT
jgi:hypothetical protein